MFKRYAFHVVAAFALVFWSGCGKEKPTKEQIISSTKKMMILKLEDFDLPRAKGWIDREYGRARLQETIAFLATQPELDEPHMTYAALDVLRAKEPGTEGRFILEWLEYETHAVGIVLTETRQNEKKRWKLPVFAHEDWELTAGTAWRKTAYRIRDVRLVLSDETEPIVREIPPKKQDSTPVVLFLPKRLANPRLQVGVYDAVYDPFTLSPDGKILAQSYERSAHAIIMLRDIGTGKLLLSLEKVPGSTTSIAFSPDGQVVAAGMYDGSICFWEVRSGKRLLRIKGHMAIVRHLTFSRDGTLLVSSSDDTTLLVWDLQSLGVSSNRNSGTK